MVAEQSTARTIYQESWKTLKEDLTMNQFARIMSCGQDPAGVRASVNKKLVRADASSARGVPQSEALAIQLLVFLDRAGFDVSRTEFDQAGRLIDIPRKGEHSANPEDA